MKQLLILALLPITTVAQQPACPPVKAAVGLQGVSRIGLGSCARQDKPQPVLSLAAAQRPDLFVWLGDNIYGDTEDMALLASKYAMLGCRSEFQELNNVAPFLAVWDDHDYGVNDGGREYPKKVESKAEFLKFWNEPVGSKRFGHEGIYHAVTFGSKEKAVQFIMLDGRTFRDPLIWKAKKDSAHFRNDYRPNYDPAATLLGAAQWAWLDSVLRQPARLRIICTGTQFGISYNGYEAWANFPIERQRMVDAIKRSRAEGVVFISGDVHYGELSCLRAPGIYPLYDLTSSGITQTWPLVEANSNRVGKAVRKNNFGLIEVDWAQPDPTITLSLTDVRGRKRVYHSVKLSALRF